VKHIVTLAVALVAALFLFNTTAYVVDETEQAIVVQLGEPVGTPKTEPGLYFKKPFVQDIRRFDKRLLTWDGDPNEIPTKGREFIFVDSSARWRIKDPLLFLRAVRDEQGARSRLNDIIDSAVRDEVSSLELAEIVRSTDWKVDPEDLRAAISTGEGSADLLSSRVMVGREGLEQRILARAAAETVGAGIELVDVKIKRLNYVDSVRRKVYDRMISERQRIATQFRSEGQGRSAEIRGQTERERREIISRAFREAEAVRGAADARATQIYAEAFSLAPEFYQFLRTLESYQNTIGPQTKLVLGSDSGYFSMLKAIPPVEETPNVATIKEVRARIQESARDMPRANAAAVESVIHPEPGTTPEEAIPAGS
jgi:membrane protease subunit HflC